MRELLGLIGAFEWRKKGVEIPALGDRIHPWYGVFSPVRGEYIDLVAKEPLPSGTLAFDIGTGTGVLAALLAQRGVKRGGHRPGRPRARQRPRQHRAAWTDGRRRDHRSRPVPRRPRAARGLQSAVGTRTPEFAGRARRVRPGQPDAARLPERPGRASDAGWPGLADPVGLCRTSGPAHARRTAWLDRCGGAQVLGRSDIRPRHPKAADADDPLFAARKAEITSLWRLAAK
jgi:hypothetical protein